MRKMDTSTLEAKNVGKVDIKMQSTSWSKMGKGVPVTEDWQPMPGQTSGDQTGCSMQIHGST